MTSLKIIVEVSGEGSTKMHANKGRDDSDKKKKKK